MMRPLLFVLVSVIALSGCASFEKARPAPLQTQPIAVRFTGEPLSAWSDMPIGVYRVPESQTVISGQQSGGMAPILLFGLIGLAAQHAAGAGASEDAVKEIEKLLRIDITQLAKTAAEPILFSGKHARSFSTTEDAAAPVLEVSGSLILTFVNDTAARPFVVLKTSMTDPKSKERIWGTQYFSSTAKPLPFSGEGSWTANGGEKLRQAVEADVSRAVAYMLKDVSSPHVRDENALTTVQGNFPFVRPRLQSIGYKLSEDNDVIAFVPRVGDIIVFGGVNIMDKASVVHRVATKEDISAFLKIIEDEPKALASTE